MTPRSLKVLVVTAAGLSAGAVLAGALVLTGSQASAGLGPSATVAISMATPSSFALDLPPEIDEPVLLATVESEMPAALPGVLLRPETVAGFAGGFALRPALTERDLLARFEAAPESRGAPSASAEDDLPVIVVSRHVTELPPRRPSDLTALEAAGTEVALLDILPPARPPDSRLRFASLDATAPAMTEDTAATGATASGQAPSQGLFGILGNLAHPGSGPGTLLPDTGPVQTGLASWYGPGFHGRRTASGERFNQNDLTAAHRTLPFGTRVRVIDEETGRSIVVRINDRGPFKKGRIIDLSRGSALALGVASMRRVKVVSAGE